MNRLSTTKSTEYSLGSSARASGAGQYPKSIFGGSTVYRGPKRDAEMPAASTFSGNKGLFGLLAVEPSGNTPLSVRDTGRWTNID